MTETTNNLSKNGTYRLKMRDLSEEDNVKHDGIYNIKYQQKKSSVTYNLTEEISQGKNSINNNNLNKLLEGIFPKNLSFLLFPLIIVAMNIISINHEKEIERNRFNACVNFSMNIGLTKSYAIKKCNQSN